MDNGICPESELRFFPKELFESMSPLVPRSDLLLWGQSWRFGSEGPVAGDNAAQAHDDAYRGFVIRGRVEPEATAYQRSGRTDENYRALNLRHGCNAIVLPALARGWQIEALALNPPEGGD